MRDASLRACYALSWGLQGIPRAKAWHILSPRRGLAILTTRTYKDAIDVLNTLQTPFKVLQQQRQAGIKPDESGMAEMRSWLSRIGYSPRDLDRLNIVHVAGTKGKGTTCAYVDSILSFYRKSKGVPQKTGLFTSPHLVSVRERIRVNSVPITADLFAKYFFDVWVRLEATASVAAKEKVNKPVYFRYLTLMSYHVFLSEGVDAAVYEVGVGGEFDATNIVERPAVSGISALGMDHIWPLGDTLGKIAWHKAGVLKPGSPGFSVTQAPEALEVVEERAREKGVELRIVGIDKRLAGVKVVPDADFQRSNASLAIVLSENLLKKLEPSFSLPQDRLPKEFVRGLEDVVWRGRCETKVDGNIRWYLDGAHTADSLKVAATWFGTQSSQYTGSRILIFNQQGRPEAMALLEGLFTALKTQGLVKIDHAVFCANTTYAQKGFKQDFVNHTYDSASIAGLTVQKALAEKWASLDPDATVTVVPSIQEALEYVKVLARTQGEQEQGVQALITGSLHLVGGALGVLEEADLL